MPGREIKESNNKLEIKGWEEGFIKVNKGPLEAVRRA
jgi:hypothetical protein